MKTDLVITKDDFFGIKNPEWWFQEAPMMPQLCFEWAIGFGRTKEFYNPSYKTVIFFSKNGYGWQALEQKHCLAMAKSIHSNYLKDSTYLDPIMNEWSKRKKDVESYWKKISNTILPDLSNQKLAKLYFDFYQNYVEVFTPALLMEAFAPYVEQVLYPSILKLGYTNKETHKLMSVLSSPAKTTFVTQERISLLKQILNVYNNLELRAQILDKPSLQQVKSNFPVFYQKLIQHQQNFFWVEMNYKDTEPITTDEFLNRIVDEFNDQNRSKKAAQQELDTLGKQPHNLKKEKQALTKKLKLPTEVNSLLELLSILGSWQDKRKEIGLKSNYYLSVLLNEISSRLKLPLKDTYQLLPEEVKESLNKKKTPPKTLIRARKKLLAFVVVDDKQWAITGKEAKKLWQAVFDQEKSEKNSVSGIVASNGHAKAPVSVVLDPKKDKFNDGDILITSMTRPEFVPLMKKASAIVTDEGGLTCHAAIVSRELNIPCVVGTKIATKSFKTGNIVEVDASHGVVTKLN